MMRDASLRIRRRPGRLTPVLLLLATACASGGRGASSPVVPEVIPPVPPGTPTSWSFGYAPGRYQYALTTDAAIQPQGDTIGGADTVRTATFISYALERRGSRYDISGTVDSATLAASGRMRRPIQQLLAAPLRFTAEASSTGEVGKFAAEVSPACDSPADPLLATARDLLITVPRSLTLGTTWTETTSSTVCRGEIPLTSKAVQRYEVQGADSVDGRPAVRIRRTSEVTIEGRGEQRGQDIRVTGNGTAAMNLFISPESGTFLGGEGDYTATLRFDSDVRQQTFEQKVKQRIRLLGTRP